MKKTLTVIIALCLLLSLGACGEKDKGTTGTTTQNATVTTTKTTEESSAEASESKENSTGEAEIPDSMSTDNGKYEIAFVADNGQLFDKSFNQGSWETVKKYAYENSKSYKYYLPSNGNQATDTDRLNAVKAAVDSGAEVVICSGNLQGEVLKSASKDYPEVKFIFIDGWVLGEDDTDNTTEYKNVASIDFNEEQSGFLAGYAAVAEGYDDLGFSGGGGGTNPSCNRFAYGYLQGVQYACEKLGEDVDMVFSWEYGTSFAPSPELQTMLSSWYDDGTDVVFSCGGSMCQSAYAAAASTEGKVIGSDIDRSAESETVITSATKDVSKGIEFALDKCYDGKWDDIGGKLTTLGVKEGAVGLSTKSWKMKNFTEKEYAKLYSALKDGEITVDRDYSKLSDETFPNVKLDIV